MPDIFIYLIKANIVLVLFYLAYRFLLRPLTFYTLNRIFLVFGIVFSTAYPFVDLSTLFEKNREFISPQLVNVIPDWQPDVVPAAIAQNNTAPVAEIFNYWMIPEAIFWIGVLIMSLRLIIQLISLYRLHRRSIAKTAGKYIYRDVLESVNPFSFLKNIYLNAAQLSHKELGSVLEHEQVHIKEWHTLDVLLSELNIIFYWFNPGAWLMKKAVKENLEFIADYRILQQGADSIAYQYDLLNVGLLKQSSPLVNHFSLLTIKRRIIMMNKQRSSSLQTTRYIFIIPLLMVLILAFTVSKAQFEKKNILFMSRLAALNINHQPEESSSARHPVPAKDVSISSAMKAVSAFSNAIIELPETLIQNDVIPAADVPEPQTDSAKYLINGKPVQYIVDGKPVSDIRTIPGSTWAFTYILNGQAAARIFGMEYSNGVTVITTAANKDSEPVMNIKKQLIPETDIESEFDEASVSSGGEIIEIKRYIYGGLTIVIPPGNESYNLILSDGSVLGNKLNRTNKTLYFINGKETPQEEVKNLSPDQISYVSIITPLAWGGTIMREGKAPYKLSVMESKIGLMLITTNGVKDKIHDNLRQFFQRPGRYF